MEADVGGDDRIDVGHALAARHASRKGSRHTLQEKLSDSAYLLCAL